MMSDKKYYQLIPEKVYENLQTISSILKSEIKGYSLDCLTEIISIIAFHIQKSDGFAPLQIKTLKALIPQADKYLSGLIDLGIVLRDGRYIPGEMSYKYKFASEYESRYKIVFLQNARLVRRIEQVWEKQKTEARRSIRGYCEQTEFLKMLRVDYSFKGYLNDCYTTETDQYNSILASAYRIINGDIYYSIDNTSRRFHSNLTNMAKDLRPYLRIKGEPLVNIDVKNSQPYLSTILLTNPGKVSWLTENPAFVLLLQTLKVSLNQDVKKYISLVASGTLYEHLMTEFSTEGLILTRDETKRQMLRILFARNRTPRDELNKKARQIFKDRFPTVHRIFSKVRGHTKGDKFHNYKRFAILLQRIESYLMLDVILKRIYKELPGTIAITIHDSIMTGVLTNNIEAVRKIMIEEFTFFVGIQPKIQIEENKRREKNKERTTIYNQYGATAFVSIN